MLDGATVVVAVAVVVVVVGATIVVVVMVVVVVVAVVVVVVVIAAGVTDDDDDETAPVATALSALTRNKYADEFVSPVTVAPVLDETPSPKIVHEEPELTEYSTT